LRVDSDFWPVISAESLRKRSQCTEGTPIFRILGV
jgi:hypothetical protein